MPQPDPPRPVPLGRAREFLGLKRSIVGLLVMVVLVGMGERLPERFLPVYLSSLGGGLAALGALGGLTNLLGALYSFPGGVLSDRLGFKRALLVFNFIAMAGYLIVILIPAWPAVIAGAVLFLSWSAISLPASMDLVAKSLPKHQRTMGVTMHSLVRRVPMALGPIVGGAFIDHWGPVNGVRLAFVAALAMAVFAAIVQQALIEAPVPDPATPKATTSARELFREMSPPLRSLLVSDILIRFCEQIPYVFVVLWCMGDERMGIPRAVSGVEFGTLTAIEMTTAVLCYVPVAYFADRVGKKPFVAATFVFFTLFPLVLLFCRSYWALAGAFVLRGLKEFGEPTRKALIMDLAPEDRKAGMFGLYYLIRDLVVSLAAVAGAFLWSIAPEANFLAASAFGALGTMWFVLRGRDVAAAKT